MHAAKYECGRDGFLQWLLPPPALTPAATVPRLTAVLEDDSAEPQQHHQGGLGAASPAAAVVAGSLSRPKMDSAGSLVRGEAGLMMPPLGKEGLTEPVSTGTCMRGGKGRGVTPRVGK